MAVHETTQILKIVIFNQFFNKTFDSVTNIHTV